MLSYYIVSIWKRWYFYSLFYIYDRFSFHLPNFLNMLWFVWKINFFFRKFSPTITQYGLVIKIAEFCICVWGRQLWAKISRQWKILWAFAQAASWSSAAEDGARRCCVCTLYVGRRRWAAKRFTQYNKHKPKAKYSCT
jgi:hypothetical protein